MFSSLVSVVFSTIMLSLVICVLWCRNVMVLKVLGSCRLNSVQPLIGSTIRAFSKGSALWVLEVLCCLYLHSLCETDHSTLWWMVVEVNW